MSNNANWKMSYPTKESTHNTAPLWTNGGLFAYGGETAVAVAVAVAVERDVVDLCVVPPQYVLREDGNHPTSFGWDDDGERKRTLQLLSCRHHPNKSLLLVVVGLASKSLSNYTNEYYSSLLCEIHL